MPYQSKELFHTNREDVKAAKAIVTSEAFERLVVMSKAAMSETNPPEEQMRGANKFVQFLMNLPDYDAPDVTLVTSGLTHELDVKDKEPAKRRKK